MDWVVSLKDLERTSIEDVGGKAFSLIQSAKKGYEIPPTLILSVDFFKPSFERIKDSQEWSLLTNQKDDRDWNSAKEVKKIGLNIEFNAQQKKCLKLITDFMQKERIKIYYGVRFLLVLWIGFMIFAGFFQLVLWGTAIMILLDRLILYAAAAKKIPGPMLKY